MIPKTLHMIWIGTGARRPDEWIDTWRRQHPDWEFRLWDDTDLDATDWQNERHIAAMWKAGMWSGISDIMRYEILYRHGGIYVDADSICERPLDDGLRQHPFFAIWENEVVRPGLITGGFMGATPGHELMRMCICAIERKENVVRTWSWRKLRWRKLAPWISVGPRLLTDQAKEYGLDRIEILPSYTFLPEHYTGLVYAGDERPYARHMWGTTKRLYGTEGSRP